MLFRLAPLLLLVTSAVAAAQTLTEGEVRKIDRAQGKLTLRHGEIRNLDMPAMTMVFRLADRHQLEGLAEGSKVRFAAEKIDGQYTITRLERLP